MAGEGLSYAAAGVDIEAYERVLERVKPLIAATHGEEVARGVGPFAGLYALPGGGHLAASADGVGTKIKVAIAANSHRGIGVDIVNHCVNDIATAGASPIFFLDYFATGKLDPDVFTQVIEGITTACREAGCALLGGETAEMPGVYALGDYDLAGFIVGTVPPGLVRDPKEIRSGDLLIGLPSSGLHTNGFSLVRKVFEGVPLSQVFPEISNRTARTCRSWVRSRGRARRTSRVAECSATCRAACPKDSAPDWVAARGRSVRSSSSSAPAATSPTTRCSGRSTWASA